MTDSKLGDLGENALAWAHGVCPPPAKKKVPILRLFMVMCWTVWLEFRPKPASANYAFSDLTHTNTDNSELHSL